MKVEPLSWMSGAAVVAISSAACLTPNPSQQAEPRPRLVVLKMLPLVAENSGPDSVSLVGSVVESERRRLSTLAELSRLALSKDRSGAVVVLVNLLLSPMNRNEKAFFVGSPFFRVVLLALRSGPARLTVGERPSPEATEMKL